VLYIKDATIYTPRDTVARGAVLIDGERIADAGPEAQIKCPVGSNVLDAHGAIVAPGFIDLQFNGGFGRDFTAEPASIWDVAALYPRFGVTAFLPTIITSPLATIAAGQRVVTQVPAGFRGSQPLGLHVEGPFLNPKKKGAHNPAHLRLPNLDAVADWSPESGVRLVTLAPELPGALDVVEALAGRGVIVSAGHSMATYDEAIAGFNAGIRYGTHLFNAMPGFAHRDPGLPGALLADPRVAVGFIADGVHTHPSVIEIVWRVLGSRRMSLVTDAMGALGMPAGEHALGDQTVIVDATSVRLRDGTLAGSILSPDQALRNIIRLTGCPLSEALATMTSLPANLLNMAGERGAVAAGYRADLVLLSEDLRVKATLVAGQIVYP
jgi:N-acetylglucosamine-6-phosphate deacetylase